MSNAVLPIKTLAIAYGSTFIAFFAIDSIWLTLMAEQLYRPAIGELLAPEFRLGPAIVFYLLYIGGLTYLAVRPGLLSASIRTALIHGAVLGLTAYGTYDLTNQATLKIWPVTLTIADLLWGTFLSAAASAAAYWSTMKFAPPPRGLLSRFRTSG